MIHCVRRFALAILVSLIVGNSQPVWAQEWEAILPDLSNIRGVCYVPEYVTPVLSTPGFVGVVGPHAMWHYYDRDSNGTAGEVDAQLGRLKKMGVNAVRVWLSFFEWERDRVSFLLKWEHFLGLCSQHKIRVMPVLWDNAINPFDDQTAYTDWVRCPGYQRTASLANLQNFIAQALPYIDDVVQSAQLLPLSEVVFCWDIWNEPPIDDSQRGQDHYDTIVWAAASLAFLDPGRHVTVGMPGWVRTVPNVRLLANNQHITVLSGHPHSHFEEAYRYQIESTAVLTQVGETPRLVKPFLANEVAGAGVGADYADALKYLTQVPLPPNSFQDFSGLPRTNGIGFMLWQAMIRHEDPSIPYASTHAFSRYTGMFYADGTVREAAACIAFRDLAITQGQDPGVLWSDPEFVQKNAGPHYVPQIELPIDKDDYAYWQSAINETTYVNEVKFLTPNGSPNEHAIRAARLFHWVSDQDFFVHRDAYAFPPGLHTEIQEARFVTETFPTTGLEKLAELERWRVAMQQADAFLTGPQ